MHIWSVQEYMDLERWTPGQRALRISSLQLIFSKSLSSSSHHGSVFGQPVADAGPVGSLLVSSRTVVEAVHRAVVTGAAPRAHGETRLPDSFANLALGSSAQGKE